MDTCKIGATCNNSSTCQEEMKAYFYKTYDATSINNDVENE